MERGYFTIIENRPTWLPSIAGNWWRVKSTFIRISLFASFYAYAQSDSSRVFVHDAVTGKQISTDTTKVSKGLYIVRTVRQNKTTDKLQFVGYRVPDSGKTIKQ